MSVARPLGLLVALCALLICSVARTGSCQIQPTFSQNGINEIAASCLGAQMALKGLKGTAKPGETPEAFKLRIKAYFAALDKVVKQTEPVRSTPILRDNSATNQARWKQVAATADALPGQVNAARVTWAASSKAGAASGLGPRLLATLTTIQSLLNLLRDARP